MVPYCIERAPSSIEPPKSRVFNERIAKLIIITNQTEMLVLKITLFTSSFFIHSSSRVQNISEWILKIFNNIVEVIFNVIAQ